jgi:CheY-like chemotaxis protein
MTGDLPPELEGPRERFVAELGERISTLRQSLARFGTGVGNAAEPAGELNALRRRVHALAAGADVLRFSRAAEALASAEAGLAGAGGWDPGAAVRERVLRILDLLPSLVLGAPIDFAAELDNPRLEPLREPLCVVVYADASLESLLHKPGSRHGIESHATREPEQAVELVTQLSPDVLLVDGDDPDVAEILPRLRQAAGSRHTAVVAVGSFDRPEPLARLMRRGVTRVLPKPTDAITLQRTLRQVTLSESGAIARAASFRKPSSEELIEAIAAEARRAFRDPAAPHPSAELDLGSDAEAQSTLWGAFARLRSLAARHSEGVVSFLREGPGGAILLAPDAPDAVRAGRRPATAPVPLHGRRVVVADDDPSVRTLLSNAFAELGATVLPARDGAEALDLAERHWPDALVSDTLMPKLDGFELCRRLRQDIALSDLPVLLVAWKEHLLACTRAPVSGRALDLLDGASLTLALRDCLATRVGLEQRLAQHDAVHGRLDGLTPRLLLQMVCSRSPNALLSLRSGHLTFEFSIADGRPVHARWYDGEATRGEGKSVLAPFLGIRTGRFSVEPLFTPPTAHFEGDAMAVLNPAAMRARHARELLSPGNWEQVEQLVLDPLATEHYASEVPTQTALLERLRSEQQSPGALRRWVAEDQAGSDPGRLHALLSDLVRHGAIGALLDREGRDLLPGGAAFRPSTAPPSSARAPAARPGSVPVGAARAAAPAASASAPPPALGLGDAVLQAVSGSPIPRAPALPSFAPGGAESEDITVREAADERAEESFFAGPEPASAALTDPSPPPEPSLPPRERAAEVAASGDDAMAPGDETSMAASDSSPGGTTNDATPALAAKRAPAAFDTDSASDESDSAWPPSAGARLRAALGRAALSLGAAVVAFVAIRALAFRSWDVQNANLSGAGAAALPASLPAPAGPAPGSEPEPKAETPAPALADAGAARAVASSAAPQLTLQSELIELSPGTKLPPGQGALEVHSWQRQRIYVDGVFMGNDQERLIPLGPGMYQLRLSDGARELERTVEVKVGRRTRVSARPSSTP